MKCYHNKNSPNGALFLFLSQEKYTVHILRNINTTMLTLNEKLNFYLCDHG